MAAALITATTVIIVALVKTTKFIKKIVHFFDDFLGEEERAGVPARPGFSERMGQIETCMKHTNKRLDTIDFKIDNIEKELQPNSGTSLRDAIIRIEARVEALEK